MAKNLAQIDEIVMDNPAGGIKRGWDKIRSVYERIFNGPTKAYVEFYDYTLHEVGDIFYAVGRERGEFRIGETVTQLAIRTSRIYKMIGGQWRQIHHHGSIDDPELLNQYQKAVRGGV
jgi:ketosteroid isomerase-like protein